ncbi:MAG: nucleotidyl transferase AbiEii/AbiGii toxin family protein [Gemmatimonadales bacterium]|jgi:hypothetical protein|nr:nucleotidyl transferase AbiEii/AbiGii toxin family protein [Gemmatimonadales bacterium]
MNDASLIALFVRPLNQLRIPYMVTGGVASVIYGEPRLTRDIDLVIELEPQDASRFARLWPSADFHVPPVEVIREESRRSTHGHFNVSHHRTALRADIYLPGSDPLSAWALGHTVIRQVDDDTVVMAPIEYVILSKLRCFQMGKSDRHLRDVHQMHRVSGDLIDRPVLARWVAELGLEREWTRARDFQEPA